MASYLAWLEETPLDQLPRGEDLTAGNNEQQRARVITMQVVVPARLAATDDEAIDLVAARLDGLYWTGSMARDA
jgi:hypothetical protein